MYFLDRNRKAVAVMQNDRHREIATGIMGGWGGEGINEAVPKAEERGGLGLRAAFSAHAIPCSSEGCDGGRGVRVEDCVFEFFPQLCRG